MAFMPFRLTDGRSFAPSPVRQRLAAGWCERM